jgi:hypothetical protein
VVVQSEDRLDDASGHEVEDRVGTSSALFDEEARLGQDRLVGQQRRGDFAPQVGNPLVMLVPAVEKRDQRTCIEQNSVFTVRIL